MKKLLKVIAVIGFAFGLGIAGVNCSNIETQDFSAKNSVIECNNTEKPETFKYIWGGGSAGNSGNSGGGYSSGGNGNTSSGENSSAGGNVGAEAENPFDIFFRSLGKLAKADGLVSTEEAELVTAFMRTMEFASAEKKRLIAAFNCGKSSPSSFAQLVTEVKNAFQPQHYQTLLQIYCDLVLADGAISEVELDFLRAAERVFGLRGFVDRWYDSLRDPAEPTPTGGLDEAYRILGLTPQSTPDEIKKAWRDKAKEFHPDKLRGKNVPENVVKLAESKFRQAQSAYEQIKKARNF